MSKKHLLKFVHRRLLNVGVRIGNQRSTNKEVYLTFAQLHGKLVGAAIELQRSPGARLSDVPRTITYRQVDTLREGLEALQASLRSSLFL